MLLVLAVIVPLLLVGAVIAFAASRWQSAMTGIPAGADIAYSDTGASRHVERPLFSLRYGLTGKPDYVLEKDGLYIPVEVKPLRVGSTPRESDVMQLAAYGLLVEEWRGVAPSYGLLKYRDNVFRVDFTDDLRTRLLETMSAMRGNWQANDVARSHSEPGRCCACGYRLECGDELGEIGD